MNQIRSMYGFWPSESFLRVLTRFDLEYIGCVEGGWVEKGYRYWKYINRTVWKQACKWKIKRDWVGVNFIAWCVLNQISLPTFEYYEKKKTIKLNSRKKRLIDRQSSNEKKCHFFTARSQWEKVISIEINQLKCEQQKNMWFLAVKTLVNPTLVFDFWLMIGWMSDQPKGEFRILILKNVVQRDLSVSVFLRFF